MTTAVNQNPAIPDPSPEMLQWAMGLIKPASAFTEQAQRWVAPMIPYGTVTVIVGDGGDGKSLFMTRLASDLTRGVPTIMDRAELDAANEEAPEFIRQPMKVLYISYEDPVSTMMKSRISAAGADQSLLMLADNDAGESLPRIGEPQFEALIAVCNPDILIIDPWTSAFQTSGRAKSTDRDSVNAMFTELRRLISKYNISSVIMSGNTNKGSRSATRGALDDSYGSKAISDGARSVLAIVRTGTEGEMCLEPVKSNNPFNYRYRSIIWQKDPVKRCAVYSKVSDLGYEDFRRMNVDLQNGEGKIVRARNLIMQRMQYCRDAGIRMPTGKDLKKHVWDTAQIQDSTVQAAINTLLKEGKIVSGGRGRTSRPMRFPDQTVEEAEGGADDGEE